MIKFFYVLLFPLFLWGATENIWVKVGKTYGIEPTLLYSIAKVESALDRYVVALSHTKMTPEQFFSQKRYRKQTVHTSHVHQK